MALFYLLLVPLALARQPLPWRALLAPTPRAVGIGIVAAVALYLLGWLVVRLLLALLPTLADQIAALYTWRDLVGAPLVWALLAGIVVWEEIIWRGAITLPLAGRLGPWRGSTLGALAFGAGHLAFGVPLLPLVAVLAGGFWALVTIRTRGLVAALVCHLLWDATVLFVWPY
jgi:membrane protease YdiL (CAAX protease family)